MTLSSAAMPASISNGTPSVTPPPAVTATTPQGKPSANINNMACIDMSTIVSIYCALAVWRRMAIQSNHCIEHIGLGGGRHEHV